MRERNWLRQAAAVAGLTLGLVTAAPAQDVDANQMLRASLQVVQMIDQGRIGELWDGASTAARKRVPREAFVRQVTQARAALGRPQARTWVTLNRQAVAGDDTELAGQYLSVEYETRFADRAQHARELTTFHLGHDGTWRFSGYVIR